MFRSSFLFAPFLLLVAASTIRADVIAGYNIPQSGPGYTSIAPNPGGPAEITASSLARSGGLGGTAFSNHFYFPGWGTAVDSSKYYSVTLSVAPGSILNLTDVTYSLEDTFHPVGAFSGFVVRSSLDGFTSNIDSFLLANNTGAVVDRTTDLTGLGGIEGSIEFRFYGTTANSNVLLGFANHLPGGAGGGFSDVGQNIQFNGLITPTPEPASMLAWGLIAGVGAVGYRLRKRTAAVA